MKYLVGIDEAGRGPIAGPVAVGICVLFEEKKREVKKYFLGFPHGKDSKKMTVNEREKWFKKIEEAKKKSFLDFKVGLESSKVIDKKGISFAIRKSILKGLVFLKVSPENSKVLLDGSLKAPIDFVNQKTIIKGDEKEFAISLASVVAKVIRDKYMISLAKKNPAYGFEKHKGYGTKMHYTRIKENGLSDHHRRTYLKKIT